MQKRQSFRLGRLNPRKSRNCGLMKKKCLTFVSLVHPPTYGKIYPSTTNGLAKFDE